MLRPDQQRPRRRATRTLLLLVAVALVILGSRALLEQSSATLNGHAASQAGSNSSGSSEGGSNSSAALLQQVDELLRDKAALEAQLAELRQQVERSTASTGSAQVQSAALHLCAVCIMRLRCPGIGASAGLQAPYHYVRNECRATLALPPTGCRSLPPPPPLVQVQAQMASVGWAAATCLSRSMYSGCWGHVAPRLECPYQQTIGERPCSVCCCSQEHGLSASLLQSCCTSSPVFDAAWSLSPPACRPYLVSCPRSFQPHRETVQDAALAAALIDKLKEQLRAELAPLAANASSTGAGAGAGAGAAQQQADGQQLSVWEMVGRPHIDAQAYRALDATVSRIIARFLLNGDGSRACMCGERRAGGSPGAQLGR